MKKILIACLALSSLSLFASELKSKKLRYLVIQSIEMYLAEEFDAMFSQLKLDYGEPIGPDEVDEANVKMQIQSADMDDGKANEMWISSVFTVDLISLYGDDVTLYARYTYNCSTILSKELGYWEAIKTECEVVEVEEFYDKTLSSRLKRELIAEDIMFYFDDNFDDFFGDGSVTEDVQEYLEIAHIHEANLGMQIQSASMSNGKASSMEVKSRGQLILIGSQSGIPHGYYEFACETTIERSSESKWEATANSCELL